MDSNQSALIPTKYSDSSSVLTEHFGYAPLAFVDDVVNAANEVIYKSTAAMDQFLSSRYPTGSLAISNGDARHAKRAKNSEYGSGTGTGANDNEEEIDVSTEIELGTAKFETLFESIVDISSDLFENYTLRNIFCIPQELFEGGWIRLEHHKGVDFKAIEKMNQYQIKDVEMLDEYSERTDNNENEKEILLNDEPGFSNTAVNSKSRRRPASRPGTHSSKSKDQSKPLKSQSSSSDDIDALDEEILILYQQIQFQQSLNKLYKRQIKRVDDLTTHYLAPVEEACQTAYESVKSGVLPVSKDVAGNRESNTPKLGQASLQNKAASHLQPADSTVRASYNKILPFSDTVSYMQTQVKELIHSTTEIHEAMSGASSNDSKRGLSTQTDDNNNSGETNYPRKFSVEKNQFHLEQELFFNVFAQRAVERVGILLSEKENHDQELNDREAHSSGSIGEDENCDEEVERAKRFMETLKAS